MLIGQFCETYPPSLDGVGRVMVTYCETLTERGHRCLYIAPENPAFPPENHGCETLLYKSLPVPGQAYRFGLPRLTRSFRRSANALPFDLMHVHSPFFAGLEARRLAKKRNLPVVATFHSKYYDDFYKATTSRFLARLGVRWVLRFFRSCDEVWTVNEKSAEVLRGYGYQGEIITMPNGTNPLSVTDGERHAALTKFPLRSKVPTLIYAGQIDYKKNLDQILKACQILMLEGLNFQLIMAGGGPNEKSIKALARELGLWDRTIFTGFISHRPTLLSLFERADLLVFPSIYDNAPMVVREAAAMGTPPLLVEASCAAEGITHGENGFLCQDSAQSVAAAIREALPRCAAVGEKAKATIPIPWDTIMTQVIHRYQALIAKKQKTEEPV